MYAVQRPLAASRQELLGTVPSLLRPTPADPLPRQQRAAMWASLRDSGGWRGEQLERRRSGETCTLQTTISTVRGPHDEVRYHVLVITDVTEQRVQRERLQLPAPDEASALEGLGRLLQVTRLPPRVRHAGYSRSPGEIAVRFDHTAPLYDALAELVGSGWRRSQGGQPPDDPAALLAA